MLPLKIEGQGPKDRVPKVFLSPPVFLGFRGWGLDFKELFYHGRVNDRQEKGYQEAIKSGHRRPFGSFV